MAQFLLRRGISVLSLIMAMLAMGPELWSQTSFRFGFRYSFSDSTPLAQRSRRERGGERTPLTAAWLSSACGEDPPGVYPTLGCGSYDRC